MNTSESFSDCIAADHPALPGHFPGAPIVPGVVLLNRVAAAFARRHGKAQETSINGWPLVKFVAPLHPGEPFGIEFDEASSGVVKFVVRVESRLVASGSFTVASGSYTHVHGDQA